MQPHEKLTCGRTIMCIISCMSEVFKHNTWLCRLDAIVMDYPVAFTEIKLFA